MWMSLKIRQESIYKAILKGNSNFEIYVRFILSAVTSKLAVSRFRLLIDKDIFIMGSINNSCCKHLFYYLQLSENSNQQSKLL